MRQGQYFPTHFELEAHGKQVRKDQQKMNMFILEEFLETFIHLGWAPNFSCIFYIWKMGVFLLKGVSYGA